MAYREDLLTLYALLDGHFGSLHWWPARDPFEVMVGAILTQNTAWTNVEKAIQGLRRLRLLSPAALLRVDGEVLAEAIRPSGYFRIKAGRLKTFSRFLVEQYGGRCDRLAAEGVGTLRPRLLAVSGIGPETADSILLYACGKAVFVSDAYTHRILLHHGMIHSGAKYDDIQSLFMTHLPPEASLFNQYHALLVQTGKEFCRKNPRCDLCPLKDFRPQGKPGKRP
jgi:endonuclease-3 related protein